MIAQEIDAGVFSDMLPKGTKLYMSPKLPEIEFKKGKTKYKVTDIRLFHPLGIEALSMCINAVAADPNNLEVKINVLRDIDESTKDIIKEIVMGVKYSARKRGSYIGGCVCYECTETDDGENNILSFGISDTFAKAAHEYFTAGGNNNFLNLIAFVCDYEFDHPFEITTPDEVCK